MSAYQFIDHTFDVVVVGAGGAGLASFPFDLGGEATHGQAESSEIFALRVPFPDATASLAPARRGAARRKWPRRPGSVLAGRRGCRRPCCGAPS